MRILKTVEDGVVTYDICDELDQLKQKMREIAEQLKEKEREAREASEDFNDSDSLYHEGRADAYGVAVAMLEEGK